MWPALAAEPAFHVRREDEGLLGFADSGAAAFPSLSADVRLQLSSSCCAWTPGSPRTSCSRGSSPCRPGCVSRSVRLGNEVASTIASRMYRPARIRGLLQLRGSLAAYREGLALADAETALSATHQQRRKRAPFVLSTSSASALSGLGASPLPAAASLGLCLAWLRPLALRRRNPQTLVDCRLQFRWRSAARIAAMLGFAWQINRA